MEKSNNSTIENIMSITAALLVMFTAILPPLASMSIAVLLLIIFTVYKLWC